MLKFRIIYQILLLIITRYIFVECMSVKFTNLKCEEFDKTFAVFQECRLKVVGRNKIAINIYARLFQVPVNNITVEAQFFRKSNDYRPFLYKNSIDMCEFFKNPSRYMFWKFMYSSALPYTNINHTCPYNNDLFLRNMVLDGSMFKYLPFPTGEYKAILKVAAYNRFRAAVHVFISIVE